MARFELRIPDELLERLKARADEEDRALSWCVRRAVEAWLGSEGGPGASDAAAVPRDRAGSSPVPATPRASGPAFARVKALGGAPRPVDRRSR